MIDGIEHIEKLIRSLMENAGQDEEFHSAGQRAPGRELMNRALLASHHVNDNVKKAMRPGDMEFLSEKSPLKKAFSVTIIKM